MQLTRLEYRHKRLIFNELEVALGHERGQRWFDDPWIALEHLGDLWAFDVGLPPEHDQAPDVTHRGWMRLVVPDPSDTRRSRWKTDPSGRLFSGFLSIRAFPSHYGAINRYDPILIRLMRRFAAISFHGRCCEKCIWRSCGSVTRVRKF